jgi:multiple sugar transport system substrate-binding protein
MPRSRFVLTTLVLFLLTVMVAACGGAAVAPAPETPASAEATVSDETFDWKRYSGTNLQVYVADTGQLQYLTPHLDEFEELTGINVEIEGSDVTSYRQNLPVRLTAQSSDFDVMATFREVDGLQFAANGWYEPLDPYINNPSQTNPDYNFADFPEGVRNAMSVDGELVTVPWEAQTILVYYRKDLLEEAGLDVPTTFNEWTAAASAVHDPDNEIYGFALRGIPYQTTTPFSSFLHAYCGEWVTDGQAAINTPEAMDAWMKYGELGSQYGPPGITGFDWPVPAQQFGQGKVFAFLDINLFVPDLLDEEKSRVVDDVGFALVPEGPCGRTPFIGGWGYAINPFSENKGAAWYFIQWATSPEINLEMKLAGWPSPRASVWNDPTFTENDPTPEFTQVVLESLQIASARMNPPVAPGVEAREIAGIVGNKALEGVSREELQVVADEQNADLQRLIDAMAQ